MHGLDQDDLEPALPEEPEDVLSDSPWTIEAVDGEEEDEERDEVHFFVSPPSVVLITLSPAFRIQIRAAYYPYSTFHRRGEWW